jgi:hypothetical protein
MPPHELCDQPECPLCVLADALATRWSVRSADANLYTSVYDFARLTLEIIYALCIIFGTYSELNEMYMVCNPRGGWLTQPDYTTLE